MVVVSLHTDSMDTKTKNKWGLIKLKSFYMARTPPFQQSAVYRIENIFTSNTADRVHLKYMKNKTQTELNSSQKMKYKWLRNT